MKRTALVLLVLAALPALAADPAANAPAATNAWAEADLRGETFERWRFAVLTDLDALEASYGELRNFFGQLGVSWPPGSSMERSGDHGFVVRNTRENLNAIRMILDILPVTVLWGELVVLEDAPATNAPAVTSARAETFERWRFTILPGLDGRVDSTDTWKSFFGQLGVSWPRGSFVEPSGDDGLVVRNTRENLDTIRMIFGGLSVNVLQGDPVVLEDAPATNSPAATNARLPTTGKRPGTDTKSWFLWANISVSYSPLLMQMPLSSSEYALTMSPWYLVTADFRWAITTSAGSAKVHFSTVNESPPSNGFTDSTTSSPLRKENTRRSPSRRREAG